MLLHNGNLFTAFRRCVNRATEIIGLLKKLGNDNYDPTEWRLFIDSCKSSLKCVLLHNGNFLFSAIPIGHSVSLKENCGDIKRVIEFKYDKHKWIICVYLRMVCFLLAQHRDTQNIPVIYVCGTHGLESVIGLKGNGL